MSGFGERFRRSGYTLPKPLIKVDGIPIIQHVVNMFSKDDDFLFICNQDHLDNNTYKMREIISGCCQNFSIHPIKPHKLGPVYAVLQVEQYINDEPLIINYCDFTCYWDWNAFKSHVMSSNIQGSIPAYKGFHPHSLGNTNYAYVKETNLILENIQEKQPFTNQKIFEYASSGTYYFSSGQEMMKAFKYLLEKKLHIENEYYVSLAYKYYLEQHKKISIYPIQHFMQWGTPQDLEEYQYWSDTFKNLIRTDTDNYTHPRLGTNIIPMAGLGKRFSDEGYTTTKPLIPVSGKPMVLQANNDLPKSISTVFVLREDMKEIEIIKSQIDKNDKSIKIKSLQTVTQGQAVTALEGLNFIEGNTDYISEPLTIGACDNGCLYNKEALYNLMKKIEVDIIVWGIRNHSDAIRNPTMYGWIDVLESGKINRISVKKPISEKLTEPIVIGTFSFQRANYFRRSINRLISKDLKTNGEYYIDACINEAIEIGLNCFLFEVDSFLSWGTPNDLKTFEYWQSCFHKWEHHSYSLNKDIRVSSDQINSLIHKYTDFNYL